MLNQFEKINQPQKKINYIDTFEGHNYDENFKNAINNKLANIVNLAKMQISDMPETQGGLKSKLLKALDNPETMAKIFAILGWNNIDTFADLLENDNILPIKLTNAMQSQDDIKNILN
jgi:hypothetical protein